MNFSSKFRPESPNAYKRTPRPARHHRQVLKVKASRAPASGRSRGPLPTTYIAHGTCSLMDSFTWSQLPAWTGGLQHPSSNFLCLPLLTHLIVAQNKQTFLILCCQYHPHYASRRDNNIQSGSNVGKDKRAKWLIIGRSAKISLIQQPNTFWGLRESQVRGP